MKSNIISAAAVSAILLTNVVSGPAMAQGMGQGAFDHVQLTVNLMWCYQQQDRVQADVSLGGLRVGSVTAGTVPHSWYVEAIQAAANPGDAGALRVIYRACQAHNSRAIDYLNGENDWNLIRAAQYVIACKATSPSGSAPPYAGQDPRCQ